MALNGHVVNAGSKADYRLIPIDNKLVRKGENIITVKRAGKNSQLVALALYDMADGKAGDLMLTPGQPSIVRGPNGWEWWLVYMANKAWKRSQHIDRIHFTGGRLYVDGITSPDTEGFHPVPAMPQHAGTSLDGVSVSDAYLLEVTFAAHSSDQAVSIGGRRIGLPSQMSKDAGHVWRIERNHDILTVWIDNVLVCDHENVDKDNRAVDVSGTVEYLSYNDGYDEYGRHFSGWEGVTADDGPDRRAQGRRGDKLRDERAAGQRHARPRTLRCICRMAGREKLCTGDNRRRAPHAHNRELRERQDYHERDAAGAHRDTLS